MKCSWHMLVLFWILCPSMYFGSTGFTSVDDCFEICDNGMDDDGDGLIDNADPDCNPFPNDCVMEISELDSSQFVTNLKCQFNHPGIVAYAPAFFADIDRDGQSEIVCLLHSAPDGFAVINSSGCSAEHIIDVNGDVDEKEGGLALGDVDNNGFVDIFVPVDSHIERWEFDMVTNQMVRRWQSAANSAIADRVSLDIIDINQDGIAEIIPNGGLMVDALTGTVYPGILPAVDAEGKGLYAFSADADPNPAPAGEGNVELIRGTTMYRYDFIAMQWNAVSNLTLVNWDLTANVSIADMDLDCDLDAVITNYDTGEMLVWDLQSDNTLGGGIFNYPSNLGSRAAIANVDDDEYPEMVMTGQFRFFVIDDIITSGSLGTIVWLTTTSDFSGHTQVTCFDFEGDGEMEIVYRDETRLRVFRGKGTGIPTNGNPSGPLTLMDSGDVPPSCISGTGMEYPTIGDIDGDGAAEIMTACENYISVYQSGMFPWGQATMIWNTQAFNVVNINQDGTIPSVQTENYTVFNNFLTQINPAFDPSQLFVEIPDAWLTIFQVEDHCDRTATVSLEICNQGDTVLLASTPLSFYNADPRTTGNQVLLDSVRQNLLPGACTQFNVQIPLNAGAVEVYAVVNDNGSVLPFVLEDQENGGSFPITSIIECDYLNNLDFSAITLTNDTIVNLNAQICPGETYQFGSEMLDAAGIYRDTLLTSNGCDSILVLTLVQNMSSFEPIQAQICAGDTYLFEGTPLSATGIYRDTLPNSVGCDSIIELTLTVNPAIQENVQASICPGDTYPFANMNLTSAGTYRDTFVLNGCDSIVALQLTILSNSQSSERFEICPGDTVICRNQVITQAGLYRDTIPNGNGCDSIVTCEVVILNNPSIFGFDQTACEGDSVQLLVQGTTNYIWSPSTGLSCSDCPNPMTAASQSIVYLVSGDGCGNDRVQTDVALTVNPNPTLDIGSDVTINFGEELYLNSTTNVAPFQVRWFAGNELICPGCGFLTVAPTATTTYTAIASSGADCEVFQSITVTVVDDCSTIGYEVPNMISPNQDGHNDRFYVRLKDYNAFQSMRLFSRWGELIFETTDAREAWNGTYQGNSLNPGVFVYMIELGCPNGQKLRLSGDVTLVK